MTSRERAVDDEQATTADDFLPAMQQISRDAWVRNRGRADELSAALAPRADAVSGAARLSDDVRERALALAHQLHGSAGTFGYPKAAEAAARIERLLRSRSPLTSADRRRLSRLADEVSAALEQPIQE